MGLTVRGKFVGLFAICLIAGAGVWAYPRYFGAGPACLLPKPGSEGPAVSIGTAAEPLRVIYGHLARLERAANPVRFSEILSDVELRGVHYDGGLYGQHVVPTRGSVASLKIDGKNIAIRNGTIDAGCIDIERAGKAILVFSGSLTPVATLVLTPEQMAKLR